MATFDYAALAAEAGALLAEFGKSLTLTREDVGQTYDPTTLTLPDDTPLSLNGVGVLVGFKANEIDGENVLGTDRKLIYQGDELAIGDKYGKYRVHWLNKIDPSEDGTIVTIAQLRG